MQREKNSGKKVLNASEIGQYLYCNVSWMLQKQGYTPDSPYIDKGKTKHYEHGKILDHTKKNANRAKLVALIGIILIFFGIIFFILEVIL